MTDQILKPTDPCPACGAPIYQVPLPTDERRALAARRDDPVPLNPDHDTASKEVVAEHGRLYRCVRCNFDHRMPASAS